MSRRGDRIDVYALTSTEVGELADVLEFISGAAPGYCAALPVGMRAVMGAVQREGSRLRKLKRTG